MTPSDDELSIGLPDHDVDGAVRERVRWRAHALLAERRRPALAPPRWPRGYGRWLEPAALLALGLSYLLVTVDQTVSLFLR